MTRAGPTMDILGERIRDSASQRSGHHRLFALMIRLLPKAPRATANLISLTTTRPGTSPTHVMPLVSMVVRH